MPAYSPKAPSLRHLLYSHWLDCSVGLRSDGSIALYDGRQPAVTQVTKEDTMPTPLQRLRRLAPTAPAAEWPAAHLPLEPGDEPRCIALLHLTQQELTPAQEKSRAKAVAAVEDAMPDFVPEGEQPRASDFDLLVAARLAPESRLAQEAAVLPRPTSSAGQPTQPRAPSPAHLLRPTARHVWLLVGTRAGRIVLLNTESGQCLEPAAQVHSGPIVQFCVAAKDGLLFSLGEDSLVQTWQIKGTQLHHLAEPAAVVRSHFSCARRRPAPHLRPMPLLMAPLVTPVRRFYLSGVPLRAALMGMRLFIVLRDTAPVASSSAQSLFVYDAAAGATMVHARADDHAAPITALAVCDALQLAVTADRAGQLKLWREDNTLMTTLFLNVPVSAACFLNDAAELLVAAELHLHLVKLAAFLPPGVQQFALEALQGRDLPWEDGDRLEQPIGALASLSEFLPPDVCEDLESEEASVYPTALASLRHKLMTTPANTLAAVSAASAMSSRLPTRQGRQQAGSAPGRKASAPPGGASAASPASAAARARSAVAEKMVALEKRDVTLYEVLSRREAAMRNSTSSRPKVSRRDARRALRELRRDDPSHRMLRLMSAKYGRADAELEAARAGTGVGTGTGTGSDTDAGAGTGADAAGTGSDPDAGSVHAQSTPVGDSQTRSHQGSAASSTHEVRGWEMLSSLRFASHLLFFRFDSSMSRLISHPLSHCARACADPAQVQARPYGAPSAMTVQWMYASQRGRIPIAPDLAIPNSVVWTKMLEWGVRPETVDPSRLRRKPATAPPQVRCFSLGGRSSLRCPRCREPSTLSCYPAPTNPKTRKDASDDEDEAGALAGRLAAISYESETEEEEEQEEEEPELVLREGAGNFRQLSARARRSPLPAASPTPPATPPRTPTPVATPEPEVEKVELKYPPLPRYLSQFRQSPWFKHHYPLATSKTFDFIRPPIKDGIVEQVPFGAVVTLLAGDSTAAGSGLLFETNDNNRMCVSIGMRTRGAGGAGVCWTTTAFGLQIGAPLTISFSLTGFTGVALRRRWACWRWSLKAALCSAL